jgi:formylglycine-generating enzyme required for sulfatase activity
MHSTSLAHAQSIRWAAAFAVLTIVAATAQADLPPLSPRALGNGASVTRAAGYEFVTVGNPGNTPASRAIQDTPYYRSDLGSVDYTFAIARTEVTYSEYLPFVRAYARHFGDDPTFALIGRGIAVLPGSDRDPNNYVVKPGYESAVAEVGWRYAARFCNWLSNDRRSDVLAFMSGSYDATTFGPPDTSLPPQDNYNRQPSARFFLPTLNEWTKAMHYDPSRYGPGHAGYWTYPTSADNQPAFGLPAEGGESSSGLANLGYLVTLPPASYPSIMSPWGLFDGSGGAAEWLEDGIDRRSRYTRGSAQLGFYSDLIGWDPQANAQDLSFLMGIRLGMVVPTPSAALTVVLGSLLLFRRSR